MATPLPAPVAPAQAYAATHARTVLLEDRPPVAALTEPVREPVPEAAPEPVNRPVSELDREYDTVTIERVLNSLEPVDQTTSFEHEPTTRLPDAPRRAPGDGGKRRAVKHAGGRGPLFKGFLSAPVLVGIAALAVSVGGVVTVNDAQPTSGNGGGEVTHAASALGGTSSTGQVTTRKNDVSRDRDRDAQADAAGTDKLLAAAAAAAEVRAGALTKLAAKAEVQAKVIAKNLWTYPLEPVVLTARFGQYGLWSSYHTGLDFDGTTGDEIHAIANGEVISASYDGSYGNKTVVTPRGRHRALVLPPDPFVVSVGDTVRAGEVIGTVGSTGHVTGSHLHVEVRPGGGDPVDPYTAMSSSTALTSRAPGRYSFSTGA